MTWYSPSWKRRYPFIVDVTGGAGGPGTIDMQITVPSDWPDFWDNIRSDAFDAIITNAKGQLQSFKRSVFNYANKSLTLQGKSLAVNDTNSMIVFYLYFDNSSSTDLSSVFTAHGPKIGKVYLNAPSNRIISQPSQKSGSNSPNYVFSKTSTDEVFIWFRVGSLLANRITPNNDKLDYESVDLITIRSLDQAGADNNARYEIASTAVVPSYIGVKVKSGSNNTDYTVCCNITTVAGDNFVQKISLRSLLQVRDLLPT